MTSKIPEIDLFETNFKAITNSNNVGLRKFLLNNELSLAKNIIWYKSKIYGDLVPVIHDTSNSQIVLHSKYDPVAESKKIVSTITSSDFIVMLGFGAGYLVEALLNAFVEKKSVKRILVIEMYSDLFISVCHNRDLSKIFEEEKIVVEIIKHEHEIIDVISRYYLPHFFNTIDAIIQSPQVILANFLGLHPEKHIIESIRSIQSDFITQSKFGKRWLYNISCNSISSKECDFKSTTLGEEVVVIGAGPSLEKQLARIRKLQTDGLKTIICDASLAFCLLNDLKIDYAVSIDGQSVSYLHLLSADSARYDNVGSTVIDYCAHPIYGRKIKNAYYMGSNHPLLSWLKLHGAYIPAIDCSSGNVGGAMVAMAVQGKVKKIHVFGLDFAYQNGNPYVKPSFFHDDVNSHTSRITPLEQRIVSLYLREPYENVPINSGYEQITSRMKNYKQAFLSYIMKWPVDVLVYKDDVSALLRSSNINRSNTKSISDKTSFKSNNISIVIKKYLDSITMLDNKKLDPLQIWYFGSTEDKQLLLTLLPFMAWYQANVLKNNPKISDISKDSYRGALKHTRRILTKFFP